MMLLLAIETFSTSFTAIIIHLNLYYVVRDDESVWFSAEVFSHDIRLSFVCVFQPSQNMSGMPASNGKF